MVEIYKNKGKAADPENYRSISLLCAAYKIYARLLQRRLSKALDSRMLDTQLGFREERSTVQLLQIIRRLQDVYEETGKQLYTLLLDWEKAFDKINPAVLDDALRRTGVTEKYRKATGSIYMNPKFMVTKQGNDSEYAEAKSGIRQGCP